MIFVVVAENDVQHRLIIRENCKSKLQMRYHLTLPMGMAIIKKSDKQ